MTELLHSGDSLTLRPIGVELRLTLAPLTLRAAAFLIDLIALMMLAGLATWASYNLTDLADKRFLDGIVLLWLFALRVFYMMVSELRGRGQTLGKRLMNLRVIDADGAPLTPRAIFLRNITREVELFIPLLALYMPELLSASAEETTLRIFCTVWALLLLAFPMLNTLRQRVGDVLANTLVIFDPPRRPLPIAMPPRLPRWPTASFAFSPAQLDMYGLHELNILHEILINDPEEREMIHLCERISTKIAYQHTSTNNDWRHHPRAFLEDLYLAMRHHHERRALLGRRQDFKREGRLSLPPADANPTQTTT